MSGTNRADAKECPGLARKLFWAGLALAGVLAVAGSVRGWDRRPWTWHPGGWHETKLDSAELRDKINQRADRGLDHIKATREQRAQVKAILGEFVLDVEGFEREREALAKQFTTAARDDRISPEEASALRTATRDLASRATDKTMDTLLKLYDVLTPEQRKQLLDHRRGGL